MRVHRRGAALRGFGHATCGAASTSKPRAKSGSRVDETSASRPAAVAEPKAMRRTSPHERIVSDSPIGSSGVCSVPVRSGRRMIELSRNSRGLSGRLTRLHGGGVCVRLDGVYTYVY